MICRIHRLLAQYKWHNLLESRLDVGLQIKYFSIWAGIRLSIGILVQSELLQAFQWLEFEFGQGILAILTGLDARKCFLIGAEFFVHYSLKLEQISALGVFFHLLFWRFVK